MKTVETTLRETHAVDGALNTILDGHALPYTGKDGGTIIARAKPFKLPSARVRIELVELKSACRIKIEAYEKARKAQLLAMSDGEDDITTWLNGGADPEETEARKEAFKKTTKDIESLLDGVVKLPATKVKLSELLNIKADRGEQEEGNVIPGTALDHVLPYVINDITGNKPVEAKPEKAATSDEPESEQS